MSSGTAVSPDSTLEMLLGSDVLSSKDGEAVALTRRFEEAVDELLTKDSDGLRETVESRIPSSRSVTDQVTDEAFLARIGTLAAFVGEKLQEDEQPAARLLQLSLVLDQFGDQAPRGDGAPDGFLPLRGDRLELVTQAYSAAIVYAWRDDCPPCDDVRATLETIAAGREGELGLFAVYGPAWARRLELRHRVVGAPTTLFLCNGSIDSRIQGAKAPTIFQKEVTAVLERADSPER